MAKEKKLNVILPPGIARFPNLWVPRAFSKPGQAPGKPKYETGVVYEGRNLAKVEALYKDAWVKFGMDEEDFKSPIKKDKKDKSIRYINAHSSDKYKPPVFDSKNRPVSQEFGGGSTIVLDVTLKPYDGFGGGITTYINAVQVRDFVAGGGFNGPRFDTIEDGFEASDDEAELNRSPFGEEDDSADDHNF